MARRAQPGRSHAAPASPSRRGTRRARLIGYRGQGARRSLPSKPAGELGAPAPGVRAHSWPWGRRLTLLRGAPGPATSDCSPQWRPPGAGARILHRPCPEPRPAGAWGACAATTLGPAGNMLPPAVGSPTRPEHRVPHSVTQDRETAPDVVFTSTRAASTVLGQRTAASAAFGIRRSVGPLGAA